MPGRRDRAIRGVPLPEHRHAHRHPRRALPESTGHLWDLPFAISDLERPFGTAAARSAVIQVIAGRGGAASAEVEVRVAGRLYLPTTLVLDISDGPVRWLRVRRREVVPGHEASLYSVRGEVQLLSPRLRWWPLRVRVLDEQKQVVRCQVFDAEVQHFTPVQRW